MTVNAGEARVRIEKFEEYEIEVLDFYDATVAERVIEFRHHGEAAAASFAAVVVPDGGDWGTAVFSVDPQRTDLSAALAARLLEVARQLVGDGRSETR